MATVLAVDDSPSIRQMIKVVLGPAGHTVIEAGDGAEGLAKARSETVNLVITDLNMPVMNGLEMIKQLRTLPSCTGADPLPEHGIRRGDQAAGEGGWGAAGSPSRSSPSSCSPSRASWCAFEDWTLR